MSNVQNPKSEIGNHPLKTLLRLSRPLHLLLAALTFSLGASIANYLGKPFRADSFWLGLVGVICWPKSA
jgi:4-hydroxybenzoate polyprenyltransferase